MLSAASLCVVVARVYMTLLGEEAAVLEDEEEIMNATAGGCMPCLCG